MIKHGLLNILKLTELSARTWICALGKYAATTGEISNLEGRHGFVLEIG